MIRGTARPAFSADAVIAGTVCSARVRGPTHHVRVPSDNRPAISSMRGPSAATTIGNGMAPFTVRAPFALSCLPRNETGSPRDNGPTI